MIIGVGVDIVDIRRIRDVLARQGDRFVHRVYTQGEREYCTSHRDPAPHYAARFAAKEAVFKALGTGWAKGITWVDVEVHRKPQDAPFLILHGEALRLTQAMGIQKLHVTLSHSDDSAVAVVILDA
jgi:holo-[acyl-carrier protein] synthase